MIVTNFLEALKPGKEIANATAWKEAQLLLNKWGGLVTFALGLARMLGLDFGLTDDQLLGLLSGAAVVYCVFNGSATVVSTTKVGLRRAADGGDNAGGTGAAQPSHRAADRQPDADVFDTGNRG